MVNSEYHNLAFTELHLGNLRRDRSDPRPRRRPGARRGPYRRDRRTGRVRLPRVLPGFGDRRTWRPSQVGDRAWLERGARAKGAVVMAWGSGLPSPTKGAGRSGGERGAAVERGSGAGWWVVGVRVSGG